MKKFIPLFIVSLILCFCMGGFSGSANNSYVFSEAGAQSDGVSMTYEDGKLTIEGLDEAANLIQASFTDKILTRVKLLNATNGTTEVTAGIGDKFFLWSATNAARPLSAALTVRPSAQLEPSNNILVAYFSRTGENYSVGTITTGNTAIVAQMIADQTGGDLFEIRPVTPYPSDYQEMLAVAEKEAAENARPEIADTVPNMQDYDVVFIGYPIWNGDMPKIVYHFLESYDFSGKTVIPFNTHEGSGQGSTQRNVENLLPNATVLGGLAVRGQTAQNSGSEAESAVKKWLSGLSLPVPGTGSGS